jgi:hypothetical protein
MDDKEKGIIEKTVEVVEEFASEIKDAAKHILEPSEPLKPGDEVVMLPTTNDGMFAGPVMPQYMIVHHPKKRSKKAPPKTAKTAAKKNKKRGAKKVKVTKSKAAVKKTTKKAAKKKKVKKSKR